jgi:hypothetical protein
MPGSSQAGLVAAVVLLASLSQAAGAGRYGSGSGSAVLIAAGDIAACTPATETTAAAVKRLKGTVATLGDNAYPDGSSDDFTRCYEPTWGPFKSRTRPSTGNHEYVTASAAAYFAYFGSRAGEPGRGYYGYRLGKWQVIALNSNCDQIGGCGEGNPEERWLSDYLDAHRTLCTLAYWHHPRFSTGLHGNDATLAPLWRDLYRAGAEIVLNGHDHNYQRFAPLTPDGTVDRVRGLREFVVGTGGANLTHFTSSSGATEARSDTTFGVLRLALGPKGYSWHFVTASGNDFTDAGSDRCHTRP